MECVQEGYEEGSCVGEGVGEEGEEGVEEWWCGARRG